jgi:hypothetical protein
MTTSDLAMDTEAVGERVWRLSCQTVVQELGMARAFRSLRFVTIPFWDSDTLDDSLQKHEA